VTTRTVAVHVTGTSDQLRRALREAGLVAEEESKHIGNAFEGATSRLGGAFQRLGALAGNYVPILGEPLQKLGEHFQEAETKGSSAFQALSTVGGAAVLGIGAAAVAAGTEAVHLAEGFDTATSRIAASAGISQQAAKRIGQEFLSTAGETTFSATEMAQAYAQVAGQLGLAEGHALTAKQALDVMRASTDMAEASGTSLGTATNALATTMQAFHLSVGDAASAADVLYNTARATNQPIDAVAAALDKLHGRLGTLAPSLSDVGAMMVSLAEHGITGTRGVSVVNTALQTLIGGGKQVTQTLDALGVHIFDSSGKFVGMQQVIAQLHPKLAGLTQQQQDLALKTLFGAGAAQAMGQIIAGGVPAFQAATSAVQKTGSAHEAAEKSTQNLHGSLEKLKAAGEDLGTKLGEALIPKITAAGQAAAKAVDWFEHHKAVAEALAGVIGGVLALAIGAFVVNMGVKLVGSVRDAGQAIAGLVQKLPMFSSGLADAEAAEGEFAATSEATGEAASMAFGPVGLAIMAVVTVGTLIATHWKEVSRILKEVWEHIKDAAIAVWHFIHAHLKQIIEGIVSVVLGPIGLLAVLIVTHWKQIQSDVERWWGDIVRFFEGIPDKIVHALEQLGSKIAQVASDAWHAFTHAVEAGWDAEVSFWTSLPSKILAALGDATQWLLHTGESIVQGLINGISNAWHAVWDFIKSKLGDLVHNVLGFFGIHSPSTLFAEIGRNLMLGLAQGIQHGHQVAAAATDSAVATVLGSAQASAGIARLQLVAGGAAPLSPAVAGIYGPSAQAPAASGPASAAAAPSSQPGQQVVNVYVQSTADPHAIASEVGWAVRMAS